MKYGPNCGLQLLASEVPDSVKNKLEQRAAKYGPDECWSYSKKGSPDKRSSIRIGNRSILGGRVVVAIKEGVMPAGMVAMHSCDRPGCHNPNHLSSSTQAENQADMAAKGRSASPDVADVSRRTRELHATGYFNYDHLRRGSHPKGKIVVAPDGRRWSSANAAAEDVGVTRQVMARRCRMELEGWRYA